MRKRLSDEPEFPEGWEQGAGSMGSISLINWPDYTAKQMAEFRKELTEREAKKIKLGFPLIFCDPESQSQEHQTKAAPEFPPSKRPGIPGRKTFS